MIISVHPRVTEHLASFKTAKIASIIVQQSICSINIIYYLFCALMRILFLIGTAIQGLLGLQCPNYQTAACEIQFSSGRCEFTQCAYQNNLNADDSLSYSNSWQGCLRKCCPMNISSILPQVIQTLTTGCQSAPINDSQLLIVLFFLCIAAFLFLIIFFYCLCQKYDQCPTPFKFSSQTQLKNLSSITFGQKSIATNIQTSQGSKVFVQQAPNLKEKSCDLCSMEGTVSKISCGHQFHKKCLIFWMEKHSSCPICHDIFLDSCQSCEEKSSTSQNDYQIDNPGRKAKTDEEMIIVAL